MRENLSDPWLAESSRGYRRDLAAVMILQCRENKIAKIVDGEGFDPEYSAATYYLLSQLDQDELQNAIRVAEQEVETQEL